MKAKAFSLVVIMSSSLFAAKAQQDSTKLYQKADDLFAVINLQGSYNDVINTTVEQQITTIPALAPRKEEVIRFFNKVIGWPVVKTDIAKLYLKYYTPEEMNDLIKFFKTAAGKKMAIVSNNIQKDIQTLQQSKLQPHVSELSQLLSGKN